MKKIIGLGIAVAVIIALVTTGTLAYFSDTETSSPNTFTAGVIDLEVDAADEEGVIFAAQDEPLPEIFNYLPATDIKPGDSGEVTLSLHLKDGSNNADLWMQITTLVDDGGLNPESETAGDDVISDDIEVLIWLDEGAQSGWQGTGTDSQEGDNIYQAATETILFGTVAAGGGTLYSLSTTNSGKLTVMDDAVACTIYYVGWSWILPSTVGNEAQGDYCTFDIVFGADQVTP